MGERERERGRLAFWKLLIREGGERVRKKRFRDVTILSLKLLNLIVISIYNISQGYLMGIKKKKSKRGCSGFNNVDFKRNFY